MLVSLKISVLGERGPVAVKGYTPLVSEVRRRAPGNQAEAVYQLGEEGQAKNRRRSDDRRRPSSTGPDTWR